MPTGGKRTRFVGGVRGAEDSKSVPLVERKYSRLELASITIRLGTWTPKERWKETFLWKGVREITQIMQRTHPRATVAGQVTIHAESPVIGEKEGGRMVVNKGNGIPFTR